MVSSYSATLMNWQATTGDENVACAVHRSTLMYEVVLRWSLACSLGRGFRGPRTVRVPSFYPHQSFAVSFQGHCVGVISERMTWLFSRDYRNCICASCTCQY